MQHHEIFIGEGRDWSFKAVAQASTRAAPEVIASAHQLAAAAARLVDLSLRLSAVFKALNAIGVALVAAHREGKFNQAK